MNTIISAVALGKGFKRYRKARDRLLEMLPWGCSRHSLHWVLRDVAFEIGIGEAVGLVGRNGAGKSTLLKILTGTLLPTSGQVQVNGRVAALLELGMGFHPDFSGVDNVLMAGQLQGFSRQEIQELLPEIIAFSEIGDAIEQPVRTYSSGMVVRLAFATATSALPDVLIVDEALAVGDAHFQHKCFNRIRKFRDQGVTLLFVSHDPLAVKSLCSRALLIENGRVAMDADPIQVFDYYNALIALDDARAEVHGSHIQIGEGVNNVRSGSGEARVEAVRLLRFGCETLQVCEGDALELIVDIEIKQVLKGFAVGFLIRDRLGNEIFGSNTDHLGMQALQRTFQSMEKFSVIFSIGQLPLGAGSYNISVAIHGPQDHLAGNFDWWDQAITFEVSPGSGRHFTGMVRLPVEVSLRPRDL